MDNYCAMQEAARKRFLTYETATFFDKKGVRFSNHRLLTTFLGEEAEISLETGHISFQGRMADFGESMCLYDWLCDGKTDAGASRAFAQVSSLPGVLVGGKGLTIHTEPLAQKAMADPQGFEQASESMGGVRRQEGDICYEIPLFSDLTALVKFYFADEEFPPCLTLLWDKNILQYIRYETVYYLADCLIHRFLSPTGKGLRSQIRPKGSI